MEPVGGEGQAEGVIAVWGQAFGDKDTVVIGMELSAEVVAGFSLFTANTNAVEDGLLFSWRAVGIEQATLELSGGL